MENNNLEYAILFKRSQVSNNIYIFIPINIVKGTFQHNCFCDEIGNKYLELEDIQYEGITDDYYVGHSILEKDLINFSDAKDMESAIKNYYNKHNHSINVARLSSEEYEYELTTIDLDDIMNQIEEAEQKEITSNSETVIGLNVKFLDSIKEYDGESYKKIIMDVIEPYLNNDNEYNLDLNTKNILKNFVNKIANEKIKINSNENINIISIKKFINELINITKSIQQLYNKLYKLEFVNKKNSEEYKMNLDYLNIALDREREIYFKSNMLYEEAMLILKYIVKDLLKEEFDNDEINIMIKNPQNLYINRIINHLNKYIIENYDVFNRNDMNEDLFNLLFLILDQDVAELPVTDIIDSFIANKAYENEIIKVMLNKTKKSKNKDLIKFKYISSFLNENIEFDMVKNNFEVNYSKKQNLSELYNINSSFANSIKNNLASNKIINGILKILRIDNSETKNKSSINLILKYVLSCMQIMDKNELEKIKETIFKTTMYDKSFEYLYPKTKTSRNIINKVLTKK